MGWAGKTNEELLKLAKGKFDAFVTVDQNLQYQQKLETSGMAVVLVRVKNNRYETFKPLVSKVQRSLETIQSGQFIRVESGE